MDLTNEREREIESQVEQSKGRDRKTAESRREREGEGWREEERGMERKGWRERGMERERWREGDGERDEERHWHENTLTDNLQTCAPHVQVCAVDPSGERLPGRVYLFYFSIQHTWVFSVSESLQHCTSQPCVSWWQLQYTQVCLLQLVMWAVVSHEMKWQPPTKQ